MGQGEGSLEVFADDLMIWYKRLTPVDIKFMYERGMSVFILFEPLAAHLIPLFEYSANGKVS